MVGSGNSLLLQAGKEVQAADHCFNVLYPVSREPRVLLQILRHCLRALEMSTQALESPMPDGERGRALLEELREIMRAFEESPQVFSRHDRFVIAEDEFSTLRTLSPGDIAKKIDIVKQYVFSAGKQVMVIQ